MNIQNIKVVDKETVIITTTEGEVIWINKKDLDRPRRTWLENLLSCAYSLVKTTP